MTKPTLQAISSSDIPTAAAPDPFDLASLRLKPSFIETTGVKKLRTTVPARRPNPQDFVRVHPSPEYRENFAMVDLKDDREDYLVRPMPRALLRGRYMAAASAMEYAGVPIDAPLLELFRQRWSDIQDQLIAEIDAAYGVYEGRTFKEERFATWAIMERPRNVVIS
jgi:hypothetical protein